MDKSQKEIQSGVPAQFDVSALSAIFYSSGRRGVRIFGLPPEQLSMATIALILLGIPLAFILAMMPFWDRVGDFALLKNVNHSIAPAIDGLAYDYRSIALPRFPLKRFLIASTAMVELIFLVKFVALFARKVRKHALFVWTCFDRTKIFQYFGASGLIFFGLWYVLFFNWEILVLLNSSGRAVGRLFPYLAIAMPITAAIFGHMAAIVGLGAWRTASRKLRSVRKMCAPIDGDHLFRLKTTSRSD